MTALAALLGGIDPQALFSLFAVSVAVAVLGCSLALAISVQAAKTHEVIIAVLALWIALAAEPADLVGDVDHQRGRPAAGLVQEGQSRSSWSMHPTPGRAMWLRSDVAIFVAAALAALDRTGRR